LVKYDANGNEEWSLTTDPGGFNNYPHMMAVDANDNIAMTGASPIATARFTSTTTTQVPAIDPDPPRPAAFLRAAYPNPFNPRTVLSFRLGSPAAVTLAIYDSAGRHVKTLLQEHLSAGDHAATWNGTDESGLTTSTGIYFARLDAGGESMSRKLIMLK
jgi:hypothetical protein